MALYKLSSQKENVTGTGPCTSRTILTVKTGECYWLEGPVEAIPPPPPLQYNWRPLQVQGPVEAVLPLQLQQENITERWPCRSYTDPTVTTRECY
jgi:hypothetical protein